MRAGAFLGSLFGRSRAATIVLLPKTFEGYQRVFGRAPTTSQLSEVQSVVQSFEGRGVQHLGAHDRASLLEQLGNVAGDTVAVVGHSRPAPGGMELVLPSGAAVDVGTLRSFLQERGKTLVLISCRSKDLAGAVLEVAEAYAVWRSLSEISRPEIPHGELSSPDTTAMSLRLRGPTDSASSDEEKAAAVSLQVAGGTAFILLPFALGLVALIVVRLSLPESVPGQLPTDQTLRTRLVSGLLRRSRRTAALAATMTGSVCVLVLGIVGRQLSREGVDIWAQGAILTSAVGGAVLAGLASFIARTPTDSVLDRTLRALAGVFLGLSYGVACAAVFTGSLAVQHCLWNGALPNGQTVLLGAVALCVGRWSEFLLLVFLALPTILAADNGFVGRRLARQRLIVGLLLLALGYCTLPVLLALHWRSAVWARRFDRAAAAGSCVMLFDDVSEPHARRSWQQRLEAVPREVGKRRFLSWAPELGYQLLAAPEREESLGVHAPACSHLPSVAPVRSSAAAEPPAAWAWWRSLLPNRRHGAAIQSYHRRVDDLRRGLVHGVGTWDREQRQERMAAMFLGGFDDFGLLIWLGGTSFFTLQSLANGRSGLWTIVPALGLASWLVAVRCWPRLKRPRGLPTAVSGAFVAAFVVLLWRSTRPLEAGWKRVAAEANGVAFDGQGNVHVIGGHWLWTLPSAASDWERHPYPGNSAWGIATAEDGAWTCITPQSGEVNWFKPRDGAWSERARPSQGHSRGIAFCGGALFNVVGSTLYTSDAAGQSWRSVQLPGYVNGVAANGSRLFVVGRQWHSSPDCGATWRTLAAPEGSSPAVVLGRDVAYVWTDDFFGFSTPLWVEELNGGFVERRMPVGDVRAMAVDPRDNQRLWAASWGEGLFETRDAGKDWRLIGLRGVEAWAITVEPRTRNLVLVGPSGILTRPVDYPEAASLALRPSLPPVLPSSSASR
jgi:hypothetical protein